MTTPRSHGIAIPFGTREQMRRTGWFTFGLDRGALLALFLQVTELYRPLGYLAGFPNSQSVNVAFLLFFSAYLAINFRALFRALHSKVVLSWIGVLLVAPVLIMLLQASTGSVSQDRLIYWSMFSLIFLTQFVVAIILWNRLGGRISVPFFISCIAATWIGFAVNFSAYDFLRAVMEFSANRIAVSDTTLRAIGFYSHPNMAAFSLCIYFTCLAKDPGFAERRRLLRWLTITGCLVGILITGSRTSLILFLIAFFWYLIAQGRAKRRTNQTARLFQLFAVPLLLGVTSIAVFIITSIAAGSGSELAAMVMSRLDTFTGVLSGDIIQNDASTGFRLSNLALYLSEIQERPLLGYGPDYAFDQIDKGVFSNISQNAWVEWGLKFGLVYSLFVGVTMIATYRLGRRRGVNQASLQEKTNLLLLIFLVAMFSIVDLFWMRSVICALGALLGQLLARTPDTEAKTSRLRHNFAPQPRQSGQIRSLWT